MSEVVNFDLGYCTLHANLSPLLSLPLPLQFKRRIARTIDSSSTAETVPSPSSSPVHAAVDPALIHTIQAQQQQLTAFTQQQFLLQQQLFAQQQQLAAMAMHVGADVPAPIAWPTAHTAMPVLPMSPTRRATSKTPRARRSPSRQSQPLPPQQPLTMYY